MRKRSKYRPKKVLINPVGYVLEGMTPVAKHEETDGYYCVVCGRFLPEEDDVIVHDDVPHPIDMDFGDEENPQ